MFFQYMASDTPFQDKKDENILNIRMRDAVEQGLKLPDWCTPEFYSYEHNKNQRIQLKIDENNNATDVQLINNLNKGLYRMPENISIDISGIKVEYVAIANG